MTTNAKTRTCRYCGRDLPVDDFPVKPGHVRARYKECAECHELGHSCVHKEKPKRQRRKYATAEERLAATKEYQRRWREAHRQYVRDKKREKYWRQKGVEPPERSKINEKCANPKPKRAKLTPEEKKAKQREYQRRYYHKHKKELNARSAERIKQTRAKRHAPFTSDEERKAHNKEYQRQWHEQHREEMKAKRHERHELNKSRSANLTERFYCSCCRCIKPAEDFITDGKQYKVCNGCRAKHNKRRDAGQKAKSPHGTGERCEYHSQYYQQNKDRIKVRRCESSGTPTAVLTDKRIVMLFEKGYSPNDIASRCMVSVERVKQVIEREGCRAGDARLCCDCWLYPCFEGMDSISTNLALTCQKYHRKEAAS